MKITLLIYHKKKNTVYLEVKSRFESVIYENHKTNILIKFINKALKSKNISYFLK